MPYVLGALLLGLLASLGFSWKQHSDISVLENNVTTCQTAKAQADTNATSNGKSAKEWEKVATDAIKEGEDFKTTQATLTAENLAALETANAKLRESNAAFDTWLRRYDQAARNESCAKLLSTPLSDCAELLK